MSEIVIYSITSPKGNKTYIGSTKDFKSRTQSHNARNCSSSILFKEYGYDTCIFTILEKCSKETRYEREAHYLRITPNLVNINKHTTALKLKNAQEERKRLYESLWGKMD